MLILKWRYVSGKDAAIQVQPAGDGELQPAAAGHGGGTQGREL